MEGRETSLPSRLTSQKIRTACVVAVIVTFIVLAMITWNSCGVQHVILVWEISKYYDTLDPDLCESIMYDIDEFNWSCTPELEILDCG